MIKYNFAPSFSGETFVFGAERPGYPSTNSIPQFVVTDWMDFMEGKGIKAVCCLLEDQLSYYENNLLDSYRERFGEERVCWAPIPDFNLADRELLISRILPFLSSSVRRREPVVVHCSGGIGRTGHVLAAWLVYGHHMANDAAISAVRSSGATRNPYEAGSSDGLIEKKLGALLDACRIGVFS